MQELSAIREPLRRDVMKCLAKVMLYTQDTTAAQQLKSYYQHLKEDAYDKYSSVLHSVSKYQIGKVAEVKPVYNEEPLQLNGFEILNKFLIIP